MADDGAGVPSLGGPGFSLVARARDTIARYSMASPGDTIVVALSGGPDSTCLFDVLVRLSSKLDLKIEVAHVDHGLAPDSADVAASVAAGAAQRGFDVHTVRAPDLEGPNLQARAREFRYGFLETVARATGAARIATGHTMDDRVETTLARLLHGAGTGGLAGLPPVEGMRIRPLVSVRRNQTLAYCRERNLEVVQDPANDDERFERVAVRRRLVAAIEERWGEGAVAAIATSAERLREDSSALDAIAEGLYAQIVSGEEGEVNLPRASVSPLPRALRRRLLEKAVGRVRDRAGAIDAALDALDREDPFEGSFSAPGGTNIVITRDSVVVSRPG